MSDAATPNVVPFETALTRYSDEDARSIGMPTPGALNLLSIFAKQMVGTPFLPRSIFKDMNSPQASATLLAVILTGREMQFSPMQSLRAFWMSPDGRLGMYGDAMMATMRRAGFTFDWKQNDDTGCECTAKRPVKVGESVQWESYTSRYTVQMAKDAGLWTKEKSIWPKYPARMCKWRVVGDIFRTLGSDLGGGQMYTREELEDDLGGDSTMGDPTEADQRRMEVLQAQEAKYHVGLKQQPVEASAVPANGGNVVQMPVGTAPAEPTPAPQPPPPPPPPPAQAPAPKAAPAAPQAPPPGAKYEVHYVDREGAITLMQSEDPQSRPETAKLRAVALANTNRQTYYVYENIDGKRTEIYRADPPQTVVGRPAPAAEPKAETKAQETETKPETGKPSHSGVKARLEEAVAKVEAKINHGVKESDKTPARTVAARVKMFFQGYFGVAKLSELPKDTAENAAMYGHAFADLEALANADVNALFSSPESEGKRLSQNTLAMGELFIKKYKWDSELTDLAFKLARLRRWEAQEFQQFIESRAMDFMAYDDVRAALRLCLATRTGGQFVRICDERKLSVAKCVQMMEERKLEKPLEQCPSGAVDAAIEWAKGHINEAAMEGSAAPAPPPQQAAAAAPAAEPEGDSLFGEELP